MIKSNFHTHTYYCDGKDSPEELIKCAIAKGFTALGFSGHSYLEEDKSFAMNPVKLKKYIDDISAMRIKYKDKIKVFLGLEQDCFSAPPDYPFEYLIGSVHYVKKDGHMLTVDMSLDIQNENVDKFYNGDFDSYAEDYFDTVGNVVEMTDCDIIGHFDLVSKFCERMGYTETERYLAAAERAVKKLVKYEKPFEINTGAIARGYRTTPYPSVNILKMIKENGGKIMFSSDCHDKNYLDCGFDKAYVLAKNTGFTEYGIITENGTEYIDL